MGTKEMAAKLRDLGEEFQDDDYFPSMSFLGAFLPQVADRLEELSQTDGKSGEFDAVNNPAHYTTGKYECIDVMLEEFGAEAVMAFCKLNAFKYLWRADKKNGAEDIEKASAYLSWYIRLCGHDK